MEETKTYPDLCTELHQRTKKVHDKSNKMAMWKLPIALTDIKVYGSVLKDFCFVFQTIEDGLDIHKDKDYISPLRRKLWYRAEQFEKDVTFYLGSDWKSQYQPSAAGKKYLDRLNEIIETDPLLLVAYVATIHLGMLAGGQIMKGIIKKTLGLNGDEGTEVFAYDDPKSVKMQLKDTINNLGLDREAIEKIFVEKNLVFQMNGDVIANVPVTLGSFQRLFKFIIVVIVLLIIVLMSISNLFM